MKKRFEFLKLVLLNALDDSEVEKLIVKSKLIEDKEIKAYYDKLQLLRFLFFPIAFSAFVFSALFGLMMGLLYVATMLITRLSDNTFYVFYDWSWVTPSFLGLSEEKINLIKQEVRNTEVSE